MTNLLQLTQLADTVAIEMETARGLVDAAKIAYDNAKEKFEAAKAEFETTIARADEIGVSRAKFKKLVEERTQAFVASGLSDTAVPSERARSAKAARPPRKSKLGDELVVISSDAGDEASMTQ